MHENEAYKIFGYIAGTLLVLGVFQSSIAAIIGFLILRLIRQFDEKFCDHDNRITENKDAIAEIDKDFAVCRTEHKKMMDKE
jgi:hypothetical protein